MRAIKDDYPNLWYHTFVTMGIKMHEVEVCDVATQTDVTNETIDQAWNIVSNFEKIQKNWERKDRQKYWLIGVTTVILIVRQLWR